MQNMRPQLRLLHSAALTLLRGDGMSLLAAAAAEAPADVLRGERGAPAGAAPPFEAGTAAG